ncbi:hypothetical protein PG997_009913 [Apiospora hydei]|uniref:Secreted protein n=1 Tax=Apiospora hydei TaxID=1337664 RepID=A0ABR1VVH5_9PEZI
MARSAKWQRLGRSVSVRVISLLPVLTVSLSHKRLRSFGWLLFSFKDVGLFDAKLVRGFVARGRMKQQRAGWVESS